MEKIQDLWIQGAQLIKNYYEDQMKQNSQKEKMKL